MNIFDFLGLSSGKWFSQRTSYHLSRTENWHQSDKTDLVIEPIESGDDEGRRVCVDQRLDPALVVGGLKMQWAKTLLKPGGTSRLLLLGDEDGVEGRLVRALMGPGQRPSVGRYVLNEDESLVLVTEMPGLYVEERMWFAAPNLRLRTSLMRSMDGAFETSSFYSEIRMGVKPPAQPEAA
jgi:CpeS-like protein